MFTILNYSYHPGVSNLQNKVYPILMVNRNVTF